MGLLENEAVVNSADFDFFLFKLWKTRFQFGLCVQFNSELLLQEGNHL